MKLLGLEGIILLSSDFLSSNCFIITDIDSGKEADIG